MKIRNGFVSNSSSSSFLIINKSNKFQDLIDFVKENEWLLEKFNDAYNHNFTQLEMIESARKNNYVFDPKEEKVLIFGDEHGTTIGHVYDYMLREGGQSENFKWSFVELNR